MGGVAVLRAIYTRAAEDPARLVRLYGLAKATRMIPSTLSVTDENIQMLIASLQASIINQTTINDIEHVAKPIKIINGVFDPFVVRSNLMDIARNVETVEIKNVPASHSITGVYAKQAAKEIVALL